MTLSVETGVGLSNAESYCSVAQADAYHAGRSAGESWTDLDLEVKERCLREATDYIEQTYFGRWGGSRYSDAQSLNWPRSDVPWADSASATYRPANVIPPELVKATCELAYRASSSALIADLGRETLSETVDVISVTYAAGSERQQQYEAVDRWLEPLLAVGSNAISITRA